MSVAESNDLREYCLEVAEAAKQASAELVSVSGAAKNHWLRDSAAALRSHSTGLITANKKDIAAAPDYGLTGAQIDRLQLTPERIEAIALALEEIAMLPDPIGEVMESSVRPNGLFVSKLRVPLGVVFFIYESRPNVTADAAAICLKSGNAVILRGGKEAAHSSRAIVDLLANVAEQCRIPPTAVQLVGTTDREAVGHFLSMSEHIDVAIPRGGEGLIRRVSEEATMPVIKHFAGNCHVYIDCAADLDLAEKLTVNSKCQRFGVCNACESMVVHAEVAVEFLPRVGLALANNGVEVRGDARTCELLSDAREASPTDFYEEYLAPVISCRVVDSLEQAIAHINQHSSHHTEAIVTKDLATARRFTATVDSSAVIVNASTRFNDGGEFGLGAEIGISTDKFHARGPCGLKELTSYKYVVYGDGQMK